MTTAINPSYRVVGQSVPRVDGIEKANGTCQYASDVFLPGMLYGKILRSKVAHALIKRIDCSKALAFPGVKGIITGDDLPRDKKGHPYTWGAWMNDYPVLATKKVRFIGEPMAVVAAVDEDTAEAALDLIDVEYEELPAVFDPFKALEPDAPIIHEDLLTYPTIPSFPVVRYGDVATEVTIAGGDVQKGFAEGDVVVEGSFSTHSHHQCYLEPHAAVAQVEGNGRVTIWTSTQTVSDCRRELVESLRIPSSKIRVIAPPIGGGFGGKLDIRVEPFCVLLAQKTRRPVKIVLARKSYQRAAPRHPWHMKARLGMKKDGTITAFEMDNVEEAGAYGHQGPGTASFGTLMSRGPYTIANYKTRTRLVYTNKLPFGGFRGFGNPQVSFAREQLIDMAALKLGLDPAEVRYKNAMERGDKMSSGQPVESCEMKRCIREAQASVRWNEPYDRGMGTIRRGRGLGTMIHCGGIFSSGALIKMEEDGAITVMVGSTEVGGGQRTVLAQIAAEAMGLPLDKVTVVTSDTLTTPYDWATDASRTTYNVGNAIYRAAAEVKERLLEIAGKLMEVDPADLEVEEGEIYVKGSPEKRKTFEEVVLHGLYVEGGVILGKGSFFYTPPYAPDCVVEGMSFAPFPTFIFAAQIAEVDVDIETGQVKLRRIHSAHDLGRAINPKSCEGQVEGAMMTGTGYALTEEIVIDEFGNVVNPTFLDYRMPCAADVPEVVPILVEEDEPTGPFGAKGIGEPSLVPTAGAIANAIYDAIGVRITSLPITPEKVLQGLQAREASHQNS